MISLIWKFYSDPVTVVPSKWIAPVERLVAFPTGVAGNQRRAEHRGSTQVLTGVFFPLRRSGNHLLAGGLQQGRHAGSSRHRLGRVNLRFVNLLLPGVVDVLLVVLLLSRV